MGKFGGFGGVGNMQQMMKQAQKMQEQVKLAQEELEVATVEASSGGGAVVVSMTGKKKVVSIAIKPEVCDGEDTELLEDLIMAAINEAYTKAEDLYNSKMGAFAGLM